MSMSYWVVGYKPADMQWNKFKKNFQINLALMAVMI